MNNNMRHTRQLLLLLLLAFLVMFVVWMVWSYNGTTNLNEKLVAPAAELGVIKSFGTLLRNQPEVNAIAQNFLSVKPQKFSTSTQISLPVQFDGREIWKNFLTPITEQGLCGNCWAHSSTAVLADRFAILSLGQIKFIPSPYDVTICGAYQFSNIASQWGNVDYLKQMDDYFQNRKMDPTRAIESAACEGTDLYTTADILYVEGVTDIKCFPAKFSSPAVSYDVNNTYNSSNLPYCHLLQSADFDTCVDGKTAMRKYRAKTAYNVGNPDYDSLDSLERSIMHEIYRNGPVVGGFMVFADFTDYYDGTTIYTHPLKNSQWLGGHAIRIVGWGEETVNGVLIRYWWIANSWGTQWGINGYFKMKRKIPECQLEYNVMTVLPDFQAMRLRDVVVPIEDNKDTAIRNFAKHYLDPTSGFYTSALEKVNKCLLVGDMSPYTTNDFPFPDYTTFYAGQVNEYLASHPLPVKGTVLPVAVCNDSASTTTTAAVIGELIDNAQNNGAVIVPTIMSSTTTVAPTTTQRAMSSNNFSIITIAFIFVAILGVIGGTWFFVYNKPLPKTEVRL